MLPGKVDLTLKKVAQVDPSDPEREIGFDSSFKVPYTLGVEHHEIHVGDYYSATGVSGVLGDGGTFILTVVTPNTTKWLHTYFQASGILKYYLRIYEGVTVNVSGSAVTPRNRNRNSVNTSGATLREDDTFNDLGTLIFQTYVGLGIRNGGSEISRTEFILKQNTTYAFHLESDDANNVLSGQLEWYEHTDG